MCTLSWTTACPELLESDLMWTAIMPRALHLFLALNWLIQSQPPTVYSAPGPWAGPLTLLCILSGACWPILPVGEHCRFNRHSVWASLKLPCLERLRMNMYDGYLQNHRGRPVGEGQLLSQADSAPSVPC